jgi:hypothetical protein
VFVGLVTRDHLLRLLTEAVRRATAAHLEVPWAELAANNADMAASGEEAEQQMAVLEVSEQGGGSWGAA